MCMNHATLGSENPAPESLSKIRKPRGPHRPLLLQVRPDMQPPYGVFFFFCLCFSVVHWRTAQTDPGHPPVGFPVSLLSLALSRRLWEKEKEKQRLTNWYRIFS